MRRTTEVDRDKNCGSVRREEDGCWTKNVFRRGNREVSGVLTQKKAPTMLTSSHPRLSLSSCSWATLPNKTRASDSSCVAARTGPAGKASVQTFTIFVGPFPPRGGGFESQGSSNDGPSAVRIQEGGKKRAPGHLPERTKIMDDTRTANRLHTGTLLAINTKVQEYVWCCMLACSHQIPISSTGWHTTLSPCWASSLSVVVAILPSRTVAILHPRWEAQEGSRQCSGLGSIGAGEVGRRRCR